MTNLQSTEVKLLGQKLVLKSSETNPEVVREVLDLVAKKIEEVESRNKSAAPHQVALLALLDLAEEYLNAKKRTEDFKQKLNDHSTRLKSWVEAEFQ